jgi:hypothetical protein
MHEPCYMHAPHGYPGYPVYQPGLIGVFGSIINLTVAALQGGARVVRTVVEGSIWESHHEHWRHDCREHFEHPHGCCRVECYPPMYTGCRYF